MPTWQDLLNYYIRLDVVPFKKALLNLLNYFHEKNVDLFKSHCSLSSTAVNMLFQSVKKNTPGFLFLDPENYQQIRRTVHGGLVLNSQRLFDCATGMKIKEYKYGDLALQGKMIISYDFNNLYSGIMGLINHLTGPYIQRDLKNQYKIEWCYENGENPVNNIGCFTWLTYIGEKYEKMNGKSLFIQSAYNIGEKLIHARDGTHYKVDGYVSSQPHNNRPVVLEYFGCLYHAHPKGECLGQGYEPNEQHPLKIDKYGNKIKNKEIFLNSMKRIKNIKESGFEILFIWECHWNKKFKNNNLRRTLNNLILPSLAETEKIQNEQEMLDAILKEKVYGIVFCSATVPDSLKDTVFEYPPIFKKVENFSLNQLPDNTYVKRYCLKYTLQLGKTFLTSFLSGHDLILPTEFVRFYLLQNYKVFNVRRVLQFGNSKYQPFKPFVDKMVHERRDGALKNNSVSANMAKLILNASVGFTLMKSNTMSDAIICNDKKAVRLKRMRSNITHYEFLGPSIETKKYYRRKEIEDMFLIIAEKNHPALISNMPVLMGWKVSVLAMAKLQMLQFFASARQYFDYSKWQFLYSDTDSVICVLAESNIDLCVKNCYQKECETKKRDIFVTNEPDICDNYTPLCLKIEAIGDKFACISAKMYCIAGVNKEIVKSAQKDVKLALNRNLVGYEQYKRIILEMGEPPHNSKYVGFLSSYRDDGFWTVQNDKRSFTGLYFKRHVLDNGYWTQPLDWMK